MTVFTAKKEPLNENTVNFSEMCSSKCKKLSFELQREILHEIWTIFPGDIEKRISENFAVESIFHTVFSKLKVQNGTGPRRTDAKWLYPTNLDANWNT